MPRPAASASPAYYPAPKRVLLAMDDLDSREVLARALREDQHDVLELEDGLELWDYLSAGTAPRASPRTDVIIADLLLPGMDGIEILELLRGRGDMTHVVLLASPSQASRYAEEARPLAAFLYEKPLDVHDIRDALFSLTGGSFHESAAALRTRIGSLARGSHFRLLDAAPAAPRLCPRCQEAAATGEPGANPCPACEELREAAKHNPR
jgi:CheY-like chemotaxis protein